MTSDLNPMFLLGARSVTQFPVDSGVEVGFVGRSNSGKSSAINAITRHSRLARTSKTPGRTREINFFSLGDDRRLVDLPGYGFAKVDASLRAQWRGLMEGYFHGRGSLRGLFITVDIRRGIGELDAVMLRWAQTAGVPAAVLLTKADKLSRSAANKALREIRAALAADVAVALFSAPKRDGVEVARAQLLAWLGLDH